MIFRTFRSISYRNTLFKSPLCFFQAEQSVDFVKKLEDVEIKEMATCKMEVEVNEGQTVKWYKDGEPIIGAPSAAPGN